MLAICLAMLETEQDQRRFARLFEAHEKKIYAVVLRILGDPTRAEDAAQQTWLKLVQNWDRVSALPWGETEGYTVTVAKNCALDILRAEQKTVAFPGTRPPRRSARRSTTISFPSSAPCRRTTGGSWSSSWWRSRPTGRSPGGWG